MHKRSKQRRLAKVFVLSSAIGGVELVLDGGSAEADLITGDFNKIDQTNGFIIQITGIPGGGNASPYLGKSTRFYWSYEIAGMVAAQTAPGISNDLLTRAVGDVVGPALDFGNYGVLPNDFDGYIGFRFENGANSADVHYGYVRAVGNADGSQLSLTTYVYESQVNTAITIIPEPPPYYGLGLLALGAAGVSLYRNRKCGEKAELGVSS